jgi:hypothetical protein
MAFNVLPTDTYVQQIAKYRTATEDLTQRVPFEGTNIQYLPSEAIHTLKAYDYLAAVIDRGSLIPRRSHDDQMTFVKEVYMQAPKLFILTVNMGLTMDFLFSLLGFVSDKDLPLEKEELSEMCMDQEESVDMLLASQALVCTPHLETDTFDQTVPFESSIPFVSVEQLGAEYVAFHPNHIKHSREGHAGRHKMEILTDEESANWYRKNYKWGFECEGKYYMFCDAQRQPCL